MKKRGTLLQFTDKDGNKQKAIAYNHEQLPEMVRWKKVFNHHINDDFTPKMDNGKNVVGLKSSDLLTIIGFVD